MPIGSKGPIWGLTRVILLKCFITGVVCKFKSSYLCFTVEVLLHQLRLIHCRYTRVKLLSSIYNIYYIISEIWMWHFLLVWRCFPWSWALWSPCVLCSNWSIREINCVSIRRRSTCSWRRSGLWPSSCWRMERKSECGNVTAAKHWFHKSADPRWGTWLPADCQKDKRAKCDKQKEMQTLDSVQIIVMKP